MTSPEAKRMVIGCVAVAGILSASRDLSRGQWPKLRIFLGVMVLGMALAAGSEIAPAPAATFALLLAATAVFTAGADTFNVLARIIDR